MVWILKMIIQTYCHCIIFKLSATITVDSIIKNKRIHVPGHFHWTPHSVASTVLYCPNCCSGRSEDSCIRSQFATDPITVCCIAEARPFLTFWKNLTVPLQLTFTYGEHRLLEDFGSSNDTVQVLKFSDGGMTIFPDNICEFTRLVEIELQRNRIENLINLRCLHFLDFLHLDYNQIKTVRPSFFSGMTYLRYLSLSHNMITYLEPGIFKYRPGSLAYIYLDGNFLTTIDLSNAALGYFFRRIDFRRNLISKVTNELNWTGFLKGDIIGGGWIYLAQNKFTRIPILSELGIKDLDPVMRGSFNYHLYLDKNPWYCDCEAYQYIVLASHASINFDGLQFHCAYPSLLEGYSPVTFRKNHELLNYLICNVTLEDKCPTKCYCYKQPSKKRVVVDCSSSDRSMMPKIVPDFDGLDVDLSHNRIRIFEYVNFLNRTQSIDLSHNVITFVDPAVYGIERISFINLVHNQITSLDKSIQLRNPCKLWYGNITLSMCSCEMRWMNVWLERQTQQRCEIKNIITCRQSDENKDLLLLSKSDVRTTEQSLLVYSWSAGATFMILILAILYYNFSYEMKLLFRTVKVYLHCNKSSKILYTNDVYVSFNNDNKEVRKWTLQTLRTFLENRGYTICLPPRDFNVGTIHVDEIRTNITTSRSFIIVLSEDYERSKFQNVELKHIWNTFMSNSMTKIVIVNYDCLDRKEIIDVQLKSFLRLGYSLDFYNFRKSLLTDIQVNIGPPSYHETAVLFVSLKK